MERSTRQRAAIRAAVDRAGRPLLAQEILEHSQAEVPGLSLATVYRNLKSLVDSAELQVVQLPGDNPRYEAVVGHHHHFQCGRCQRVFDIHACPGNMAQMAPPGFKVEHHDLTLYGVCADCLSAGTAHDEAVEVSQGETGHAGQACGPSCGHTPRRRSRG